MHLSTENNWDELTRDNWIRESDFIITTIHKIIPSQMLEKHGSKMINIHYSILPAFKGRIGKKTILSSIEYGSKLFGATCHQVTTEVDAGPPICQVAYASQTSRIEELSYQCFLCGCVSLFNAIASKTSKAQEDFSSINTMHHQDTDYIINPCHNDTQAVIDFLGHQKFI